MINSSKVLNDSDNDKERLDIGNFALRKVTIARIKDENDGLVVSLENPILMEVSQFNSIQFTSHFNSPKNASSALLCSALLCYAD